MEKNDQFSIEEEECWGEWAKTWTINHDQFWRTKRIGSDHFRDCFVHALGNIFDSRQYLKKTIYFKQT
jgi:hypothetical protein